MEVHAHTHTADSDHHRGKKKWTHYFWEFFMLFLAVTAGFFVENQREHMVEHKREKQYMTSMLADMKSDTLQLRKYIDRNNVLVTGLDSLFTLVKKYQPGNNRELNRKFDQYASWILQARLSNRTITQLNNAGGMRLIRVQLISDSILVYEERKRLLVDQGQGYLRANEILTDLSGKMLDYQYLLPLNTDRISSPQPFSPVQLFEFANGVKLLKDQIETYIVYLKELSGKATNVIALIQKHYHLK